MLIKKEDNIDHTTKFSALIRHGMNTYIKYLNTNTCKLVFKCIQIQILSTNTPCLALI